MKDRRYIKEFAVRTGQPLGDVAQKLGITTPWMSQLLSGARVSMSLARSIELWSGGEISAEKVMEERQDE
jgi:hypothetical protein